ncbi:putative spermidine/putrescine transport system ATP-binding protein [Leucobacter exalbidus]|uniref:Spermidine/putrescine transport system ATP-binding protein n=1 Tax=Leucobacter exalbidus TaxID=662960 RepID=A0A940T5Q0_9MICO|nr:ABC transporter ATP-binding protein [Leucobacter exalbidus]MBP1326206.1 putative spermidine/putrescine transport system ATP-binding protein [Leucobacter exalbidus]
MSHTSSPGSAAGFGSSQARPRKNEEHTHLLATAGSAVSVKQVTKQFGDFTAVKDLDIEIRDGEFFSMLGPSGSGKTTVLRMIAGFEAVTSGTIELHGTDVTNDAPFDREVNTVFQDYALFPHLTIAENVAYGLKVRKVAKTERDRLVREALEQVQLTQVADRRPSQLSGGQRQRIALARALILRPRVLLLDEPLGALDKQLREQMQVELKQIQREVGITFIFVTHDQEEALTLSDRVAVFNNGKIEQVGTPREVYEFPQTEFVAQFLGTTNLLPVDLSNDLFGDARVHSVRPERVHLTDPTAPIEIGTISIAGTIAEAVYAGPTTKYLIDTDRGVRIIAEKHNSHTPSTEALVQRGDRVSVSFRAEHATPIPEPSTASSARTAA